MLPSAVQMEMQGWFWTCVLNRIASANLGAARERVGGEKGVGSPGGEGGGRGVGRLRNLDGARSNMRKCTLERMAPPIQEEYRMVCSGMYSGHVTGWGLTDGGHNRCTSETILGVMPGMQLPPPHTSSVSKHACRPQASAIPLSFEIWPA